MEVCYQVTLNYMKDYFLKSNRQSIERKRREKESRERRKKLLQDKIPMEKYVRCQHMSDANTSFGVNILIYSETFQRR